MARSSSHFIACGPQADPCPELPVESGPQERGVGSWVPQDKHRMLAEYLFATRMAWRKPAWKHRVLIDPFCGPGRIRVRDESSTRDGGAAVAWRESQAGGFPFTQVFVGDKDPARALACETRLRALGAPAVAIPGPASNTIRQMVAAVPKGALVLAYIDPYNLEHLTFDLFEALAPLRVDIAAHFSTMDLVRNADLELDPDRDRFHRTAPGWRDSPEAALGSSKTNIPARFFAYWEKKVRSLGFTSSKAMPLIKNDAGAGIYRLVFFAKHELPVRVWGDVAKTSGQLDLI